MVPDRSAEEDLIHGAWPFYVGGPHPRPHFGPPRVFSGFRGPARSGAPGGPQPRIPTRPPGSVAPVHRHTHTRTLPMPRGPRLSNRFITTLASMVISRLSAL